MHAHFDMYYVPLPEGEWEYEVDDYGVVYAEAHWPLVFRRAVDDPDVPTGVYRGMPEWACTLRLAPNTEYRSWRAQYVLLGETCSSACPRATGAGQLPHV
jgi:hypothetical protein